MPFPNPDTQFKKGQSGFAGRHHKRPDIEALDKLIAEMAAEPSIARTWLAAALGDVKKGIPPNPVLFKLLIEYRNGKVPDRIITETDADSKPPKRIDVPLRDRRKDRRKAKESDPDGSDSP